MRVWLFIFALDLSQFNVSESDVSSGMRTPSSYHSYDCAPAATHLRTSVPSTLIFADCGVNPNPEAAGLVDIAIATIKSHQALIGTQPRLAFLCYSTKGSAAGELVDKMAQATEMTKARVAELGIDAIVQADAALVPKVAAQKAPGSPVEGKANILIFPDLNCGNICYKMTQRLAKAEAYGPILQGLAKPVNDLSRGCSAEDIAGVATITACQALCC